jgi:AraC-like DNA-binding protein
VKEVYGTMKISFQIQKQDLLPELLVCWRLEVAATSPLRLTDIFIPELFFDFFFIQQGQVAWTDSSHDTEITLPQQTLKTLHTRRLDFILSVPLVLYGARFTLPFAELFGQEPMPANAFLAQKWLTCPVNDLATFSNLIETAVNQRRTRQTRSPMLLPTLVESDWLAAYSARHKRRLYKKVFGMSQKEIWAVQNIHQFLGRTCDFTVQMPRIVDYVDADSFYDQPHLNNAFKKWTGLSPLAYFEANSILQDNLMAVSYNAYSDY